MTRTKRKNLQEDASVDKTEDAVSSNASTKGSNESVKPLDPVRPPEGPSYIESVDPNTDDDTSFVLRMAEAVALASTKRAELDDRGDASSREASAESMPKEPSETESETKVEKKVKKASDDEEKTEKAKVQNVKQTKKKTQNVSAGHSANHLVSTTEVVRQQSIRKEKIAISEGERNGNENPDDPTGNTVGENSEQESTTESKAEAPASTTRKVAKKKKKGPTRIRFTVAAEPIVTKPVGKPSNARTRVPLVEAFGIPSELASEWGLTNLAPESGVESTTSEVVRRDVDRKIDENFVEPLVGIGSDDPNDPAPSPSVNRIESGGDRNSESAEESTFPETESPVAERLLGRRATLPRPTIKREATGESLLNPPRTSDVTPAHVLRKALRTLEMQRQEENPTQHTVESDSKEELNSLRRTMDTEEEVEATLSSILEESTTVEEAHRRFETLLAELRGTEPILGIHGARRIRDPEAFRRSMLFTRLLLLPDLRTGPTWMREVAKLRAERGYALRLSEDLTLRLEERPTVPGFRLDGSGSFVEETDEPLTPTNAAVTHLLTKGDTLVKPNPEKVSSVETNTGSETKPEASPTSGCTSVGCHSMKKRRILARLDRYDFLVRSLQGFLLLALVFATGVFGGRSALKDPGLLHVDRLAFVDLTSLAKSGFPQEEGFAQAFREVLDEVAQRRGVQLVAKNFLLTGTGPETVERDATVEVLTGLVDRLGIPGARGMRTPSTDIPEEVARVFRPQSTETANAVRRRNGAFDDETARGRGTDVLDIPYLKPLPEDASRTLFATEHAARASRLAAMEAEKKAVEATRAAEDLRKDIERRQEDLARYKKSLEEKGATSHIFHTTE